MAGMLPGMKARTDRMLKAASEGFINATDLADYLVMKGLPFRSAYKVSGALVKKCIREGKTLETLSIEEYKQASALIEEDVYTHIDLSTCVSKRVSAGGTSVGSVEKQIAAVRKELEP
jgi:argininosuccinate lyase